jgi:hypothetical protein
MYMIERVKRGSWEAKTKYESGRKKQKLKKRDTNQIWLINIIYVSFYIQDEPKAPVHSAASQKVPHIGHFRWCARQLATCRWGSLPTIVIFKHCTFTMTSS